MNCASSAQKACNGFGVAFGRHAIVVFKMTMARTTIEDGDLGNEDWGPVKASEEVWRIRTRTWDPHLSFTWSKYGGIIWVENRNDGW